MTIFRNWITELPPRCDQVLRLFGAAAARSDVEVTLLLAIGNLLLVGTLERLADHWNPKDPRRGYDHRQGYREALSRDQRAAFDALLGERFVTSEGLWGPGGTAPGLWQCGVVDPAWPKREPDRWTDARGRLLPHERAFPWTSEEETTDGEALGKTVGQTLAIIRNALSHGEVLFAPDSFGHIGRVVFVSSIGSPTRRAGHEFVATPPEGFRALLDAWRDALPLFGYDDAAQHLRGRPQAEGERIA